MSVGVSSISSLSPAPTIGPTSLRPDRLADEKFAVCAGEMHPFLMGRGFHDAFPELAPTIVPVFEQTAAEGLTTNVDNILLFCERNGFVEETYFVGQYIPLRGDGGEIEGFYSKRHEIAFDNDHKRTFERP